MPEIVADVVDVRIRETVVVMRFESKTEELLEHYHSQVEKIVTAAVAAAKGSEPMWRIAAMMASAAGVALAQAPAFEVASIRMSPGGMTSISPSDSPGFTAKNISMQILISLAYGGDSDRVQGPGWIGSQQYDVTAKSEGGRKLSYDELKRYYKTYSRSASNSKRTRK